MKPLVNDGAAGIQRSNDDDRATDHSIALQKTRFRLESVQVCRGVAALLVLLFHTTQLSEEKLGQPFLGNLFAFGSAGVDFFFVLSGFIIFFVHQADLGRRDRLKPFILKRLIRIYPLYWLITLAILPVYFLAPQLGYGYERDLAVIIKSLLLVPQQHFPILIVGWSLSYEILFYSLFALAILLPLKRFSYLLLGCFIGTVAVLLSSLSGRLNPENHFLLQFLFNAHNLEFLLGCLAAYLVLKNRFRAQSTVFLFSGTFLFLLFGIAQMERSLILNPILAYGMPSMLIVLGSASFDMQRSRYKAKASSGRLSLVRLFTSLGDASYAIYLTHYLCLSVFLKLTIVTNLVGNIGYPATISLLLITALSVGYFTYLWIERPMVNGLRRTIAHSNTAALQPLQ